MPEASKHATQFHGGGSPRADLSSFCRQARQIDGMWPSSICSGGGICLCMCSCSAAAGQQALQLLVWHVVIKHAQADHQAPLHNCLHRHPARSVAPLVAAHVLLPAHLFVASRCPSAASLFPVLSEQCRTWRAHAWRQGCCYRATFCTFGGCGLTGLFFAEENIVLDSAALHICLQGSRSMAIIGSQMDTGASI